MAMKIQKVKLADIFAYYNNPRDNANAVDPVIESLKKFGFIKPIMVDKNMVIICGHTRYIAAYQSGCEYVPIIVSDMPDEQAKRFRILDNKIAEKSMFDENELIEELKKMEAPKEMQAFFFEDIDMMLNFSLDQFNQQVDAAGGFADMSDYNQGGGYQDEDENPYGSASDEDGDNFEEQYQEEDIDPAEGLFQRRQREDGLWYMKVVCPYCGNIEEIELEEE